MSSYTFIPADNPEALAHATAVIGGDETIAATWLAALAVSPHDTVTLSAGADGGIKEVRSFATRMQLSPQFGPVRLGIITEAEQLTPEAQNALLKLLEEPPERAKIILFIRREAGMLATVLSRCRRYITAREPDEESPLFTTDNPVTRLNEAETLAKQEDLTLRAQQWLNAVYRAWCRAGRPESGLDELLQVWYFYEQLESQINKRLILEQVVLHSLPGEGDE